MRRFWVRIARLLFLYWSLNTAFVLKLIFTTYSYNYLYRYIQYNLSNFQSEVPNTTEWINRVLIHNKRGTDQSKQNSTGSIAISSTNSALMTVRDRTTGEYPDERRQLPMNYRFSKHSNCIAAADKPSANLIVISRIRFPEHV